MTDNEIIKALECCIVEGEMMCNKCPLESECAHYPFDDIKAMYALDLIKRQQAEIERLKEEREMLLKECKRCGRRKDKRTRKLKNQLKTARKKAVNEFAERLKEKYMTPYPYVFEIAKSDIDNLVKEMTEGEENVIKK